MNRDYLYRSFSAGTSGENFLNIYETIRREVGNYDGTAVIDRGQSRSYPELFREADRLRSGLASLGVAPLARVGLLADDSFEYIAASLAILAMNAALVPVSTRTVPSEREAIPEKLVLNFLLCSRDYAGKDDLPVSGFPGFFLRPLKKEITPLPLPDGKIPAFIRFSSGTTGDSKGVVISHRSVIERTDSCTALQVERGEYVFWVLDMAFHFVVTILLFLRKSAAIVICGQPLMEKMVRAFRDYPLNLLYATPYHFRLMTHSDEFMRGSLSGVRRAFSTAMKLENADAEAFERKFGFPLTQAYGIIEVGLPCVNSTAKKDSVGRLQPAYEARIAEPDIQGIGRILLRGPGMFDAYLEPFRLRDELCPDGWFDTGDLGYLDSERDLFIIGRSKNVINFAGMKIFPYEVESVLNAHEWVRESRVTSKPFPGFGEVPVAQIVPVSFDALPENWIDLLRRHCFANLAEYKVPKYFELVDSLPHTSSGKIIRQQPTERIHEYDARKT